MTLFAVFIRQLECAVLKCFFIRFFFKRQEATVKKKIAKRNRKSRKFSANCSVKNMCRT